MEENRSEHSSLRFFNGDRGIQEGCAYLTIEEPWKSHHPRFAACPGVGASITNAVKPSRLALIRPGFAGPPSPPGEGIGKACMAYVENYRSNPPNVP